MNSMQGLSVAARWAELDSCLAKLVAAVNIMRQLCHSEGNGSNTSMRDFLVPPDAAPEAHTTRDTVVATLAKLHMLVAEPADILSQLATQNQMLACLHWLGQFQILAFIPNLGSIALQDIAELADVPKNQLRRIVRMTAAVGFLYEPRPGHVEHTALSAPFGNRPSYHDALMFLTNTAAPAAMQMVTVTQRMRLQQQLLQRTSYNDLPLASSFQQQVKPRYQWPSYLRYALGDQDSSIASIFDSFDWASLGVATVVDVGAQSTTMACALAESYPSLKLVVQMSSSPDSPMDVDTRIAIQNRSWAMPQTVRDAAVYALRVPHDFPTVSAQTRAARLRAELEAHLSVLRDNDAARLILTAPLLPHAEAANDMERNFYYPDTYAIKGLMLDMSLLQLANDRELEVADLSELMRSVGDGDGYLVVESKLQVHSASRDQAFEIRYKRRMP
ncbi:hypothetical protein BGZ60DRAFT_181281 [Tricladium varicosporioides]|nr:hypothetical protein BGZ60DRAFT_181281 [Hymenoscyphus varicosporioides]